MTDREVYDRLLMLPGARWITLSIYVPRHRQRWAYTLLKPAVAGQPDQQASIRRFQDRGQAAIALRQLPAIGASDGARQLYACLDTVFDLPHARVTGGVIAARNRAATHAMSALADAMLASGIAGRWSPKFPKPNAALVFDGYLPRPASDVLVEETLGS